MMLEAWCQDLYAEGHEQNGRIEKSQAMKKLYDFYIICFLQSCIVARGTSVLVSYIVLMGRSYENTSTSWSTKQVGGPCFAHSMESSVWFLRAWIELLPEAELLRR